MKRIVLLAITALTIGVAWPGCDRGLSAGAKFAGSQTLTQKLADKPIDLAA